MHKEKGVLSSGFFLEEVGGITRGGIKYQIWIFWDFGEERWNWQNDFGFSNDLLGIFLTYSFLCEKLNLRFLYFAKFPILQFTYAMYYFLIDTYLPPTANYLIYILFIFFQENWVKKWPDQIAAVAVVLDQALLTRNNKNKTSVLSGLFIVDLKTVIASKYC